MLEFNSRNIIVGYIKQLLYTFNLPCCKVFKNEEECDIYFSSKDRNVIKYNNDIIVIIKNYKDGKDYFVAINLSTKQKTIVSQYRYNHTYINLTKTLKLQNNKHLEEKWLYKENIHVYQNKDNQFL